MNISCISIITKDVCVEGMNYIYSYDLIILMFFSFLMGLWIAYEIMKEMIEVKK